MAAKHDTRGVVQRAAHRPPGAVIIFNIIPGRSAATRYTAAPVGARRQRFYARRRTALPHTADERGEGAAPGPADPAIFDFSFPPTRRFSQLIFTPVRPSPAHTTGAHNRTRQDRRELVLGMRCKNGKP